MKITKKHITVFIGIPLSIFFLWLALRGVDFKKAGEILKGTNYFFIIPAALAVFGDFSLRAARWKILLSPVKSIKYTNLLSAVFIGFMANNVLPLRAGELIRIVLIGRKENISKTSATATIGIERVFDVFAILSLSVVAFIIYPFPPALRKSWFIAIFILTALILLLYGFIYSKEKTLRIVNKILRWLPGKLETKTGDLMNNFIKGLEILRNGRRLLMSLAISLAVWSLNVLGFYLVARGMGIEAVTYAGAILIMAVIAIGISVPSSPGFIGIFEAAGVFACLLLGVEKTVAAAFIMLVHVMHITVIVDAGMLFLAREHISLIKLEKEAENRA